MKKLLLTVSFLGMVSGSGVQEQQQASQQQQEQRELSQGEVIAGLSEGMGASYKNDVIRAIEGVGSAKWTWAFVKTVNELYEGMNIFPKSFIILAVDRVDPSKYKAFVDTVNALSNKAELGQKIAIINAVSYMSSEWWGSFVGYAKQKHFFSVVYPGDFLRAIEEAFDQNKLDTAEQFEAIVNSLWNSYKARGEQGSPQ
jgi:hypothetical protein